MKAYLPFLLIPLAVGGAIELSPNLANSFVPSVGKISIQQLTLPPTSKDVTNASDVVSVPLLRLEALMPSYIMTRISPPPVITVQRTAAERYRLSSVLLSPEKSSAVINGEVKLVGSRVDEYRVSKISKDAVTLKGPNGLEKIALDSIESTSLFRIGNRLGKTESNKMSFTMPAKLPQTPIPSDELERQFRHLLENFSH